MKSACVFVCPYKLTHTGNFSSGKYSLYTRDKGPTSALEASVRRWFFSKPKSGCGDLPQTSSLAFIVGFSGVLQLKNTKGGLSGSQEMHISSLLKSGHDLYLREQKWRAPLGFAGRILKNNTIERL